MGKSLLVGKLIYNALISDTEVSKAVGTKVFPIVAESDTQFPFIVYSKTNAYTVNSTKDGYLGDDISFTVTVLSDKYFESCEIAQNVKDLFENCMLSNDDLAIYNIRLTGVSESFNQDCFTQELNFECNAE